MSFTDEQIDKLAELLIIRPIWIERLEKQADELWAKGSDLWAVFAITAMTLREMDDEEGWKE